MFPNRIVAPSVGGSRCAPAVGDGSPPERLDSGQLFQSLGGPLVRRLTDPGRCTPGQESAAPLLQLAARSFRSTSLGGAMLSLRVSGIPCSSRPRVFVISARPTLAGGFGPRLSSRVPN
jgi:hypothetical protein